MTKPELSRDEPIRLAALHASDQLDTPLDERFEVITRMAQNLFGVPIAAISMVDADRQWFRSIQGLDIDSTSRDVSFCGHTILQDDVLVVHDARDDDRFNENPLVTGEPHIVFYSACPIRSPDGSNIASLCLIDHQPRDISETEAVLLRDLARVAEQLFQLTQAESVQTELLGQIEAEQRNALVDPLTRLWNRGAIDELLERELCQSQRSGEGCCVVMIDLDHFKQINDEHGHPVGDEVLRAIAKRLLSAARRRDCVGRYGGEEFLMVVGGCDRLETAERIAERCLEELRRRPIETDAGELAVTASVGVTYAAADRDVTAEGLVKEADRALYRAKADGRNCVRLHGSLDRAA